MAKINGKPSVYKSDIAAPKTAILAQQRAGSLRTWLKDLDADVIEIRPDQVETARTNAAAVIQRPPVEKLGGTYRLEIAHGTLTSTCWKNIYAFHQAGDLLAFFAEAPHWYALVPGADKYKDLEGLELLKLAPIHGIGGIPLLRSRKPLRAGKTATARIPIFKEEA